MTFLATVCDKREGTNPEQKVSVYLSRVLCWIQGWWGPELLDCHSITHMHTYVHTHTDTHAHTHIHALQGFHR